MGLYVIYLDCTDCEDGECIQSHFKNEEKRMTIKFGDYINVNGLEQYIYCGKYKGKRLLYNQNKQEYTLVSTEWGKQQNSIAIDRNKGYQTIAEVRRRFYIHGKTR